MKFKVNNFKYRIAGDTDWCTCTEIVYFDQNRSKTYRISAGYFPAEVLQKIRKDYEFTESEIRNIIDNALASMKRCLDRMMD